MKPLSPTIDFTPTAVVTDSSDDLPTEPWHSLGLQWGTLNHCSQVKTVYKDRKFRKQGLLGHLMSPYDPQGSVSRVMIDGKLIQRDVCPPKNQDQYYQLEWGDPLPDSPSISVDILADSDWIIGPKFLRPKELIISV